jgi:hypothetical protein
MPLQQTVSARNSESGYHVLTEAMNGNRAISLDTGDRTLINGDSNGIFVATKASATQTYTFPKASTVPGMQVTLICGNAGGEINTAVDAADSVVGLNWAAIGVDADTAQLSTTAGHGIKNTGATNVVGDQATFVSDGVLTWFLLGQTQGIWAAL